jgi:hypothetical protein
MPRNGNTCTHCGGNMYNTTSDGEVQKCDTCCVVCIEGKTFYAGQDCECEEHDLSCLVGAIKVPAYEVATR